MQLDSYVTCNGVASLFKQRDLGELVRVIASANDLAMIPKTVIFSQTKDEVHKVHSFLSSVTTQKHSVMMYHASQSEETKSFIRFTFKSPSSELRCLSATLAFGMVCVCLCARHIPCKDYTIMLIYRHFNV